MPLPVDLRDVVDAMDVQIDGWLAYINRETGELVGFSEAEVAFVQNTSGDDEVPEWQADMVAEAVEAQNSEKFVALPDRFDIHEYAIMKRFCETVEKEGLRHELLDAIRGSGAFRRFKAAIHRHAIAQAWWDYRDAAIENIAVDFLKAEGIPFRRP